MYRHVIVTITITIYIAMCHSVYGAPQYDPHNPGYDATSLEYHDTPHPVYVPPQDYDSAASSEYASPSYAVTSSDYEEPISSNYVGGLDTFQTSFSDQSIEHIRPPRDEHLEECYCVPQGQCPANKIVSTTFKDYSNLINPRNKNSNAGITSLGRTLVGSEENTKEEISEKIMETILKSDVFGTAR